MLAARLAAAVRQLPGVLAAEPSNANGSLLLVYDPQFADPAFWTTLDSLLAHSEFTPVPTEARRTACEPPSGLEAAGAEWAYVFFQTLLKKAAERSALAVLAALL